MNVGILGAGGIAKKMTRTLNMMEGAMANAAAYAVGSRSYDKAAAFAKEQGVEKAYGSYAEMLKDPAVDLVYVAVPHSHHYEYMKLCLEYGKNILCEKPFTVNADQAKEILAEGEKQGLLVAEAIWPRYLPIRKVMDNVIAGGAIGKANSLSANLCWAGAGSKERLRSPALAGGALLDAGVYVINFALMTFGNDIKDITSTWVKYETGVDAANSITFTYNDGRMAILQSSMVSHAPQRAVIFGEKGYIEFEEIINCRGIKVFTGDAQPVIHEPPKQLTGYEYQVEACCRAIAAGETECPEMPHREIIRVMEIMDQIRKSWGLKYPME
ncbi:oxidoreductase [Spirochaetia bacterium]|nr:oxidoreductase [Spirochaetia bacterium]